ncbi:TetR/AcrR family transcriptional regulator [Steroidobacter flavus]|uniref:TetR/AcrR family transcriptional regulator n=1 Tax=Steroidobacter flavus TaxID=1842136 RepID=A0ABV8T356_9GAMM
MATKSRTTPNRSRQTRQPLGRDAWLAAARDALIEEGTAGVEVNKLAKRLEVTRGGFYWFFESREQLLDALLGFWAQSSTVLFEKIATATELSGLQKFKALVDLWISEKEYDPKWDGAVRDWARTSPKVLDTVHAVDEQRVGFIEQVFRDLGYKGKEAHVRARVTYYHQVGYYALGVRESRKQRLELIPYYTKILTQQET